MSYATPAARNATSRFGEEGYNELRDAILAAVYTPPTFLGGSRRFTVEGTDWQDAHDVEPFTVPDSASAGAAYRVDITMKTADASTSITARIRNITDSTTAATSSAVTATSFATQALTFTPVVGKEYRLQFLKSDDVFPCWGVGTLRRSDS